MYRTARHSTVQNNSLAFRYTAFCISDSVENIVRMKQRKKRLRVLKLYVKWLHDEKGVVYKVKFDKQYAGLKQYYDRINVDYEKI